MPDEPSAPAQPPDGGAPTGGPKKAGPASDESGGPADESSPGGKNAGPASDESGGPPSGGRTEAGPRVRVVLADLVPDRLDSSTRRELAEQTRVGELLVRGLVRAQLALALRLASVVLVALVALPLLFAVAPTIAQARLFGIAVPWLLLGVAAYPFLFGVGWVYLRMSERNERDFADLVERPKR